MTLRLVPNELLLNIYFNLYNNIIQNILNVLTCHIAFSSGPYILIFIW